MHTLLHSVPPTLQQTATTHASAETPGHSPESLGQSLVGSLLLSPGSWYTQGSVCALQEPISQSWVSSGSSVVGLMVTSSKRAYAIPRSSAPRAPAPAAGHCWPTPPQTMLKHCSGSISVGLWVLVHTRFVWVLWASLAGMAFDSRYNFTPPTVLLWLLLCPWMWDISSKSLQCHAASTPLLEYTLSFFSEKRFWG